MPGSDKIALDPVAAAGDPMERMNARVAELERQIASLRIPTLSPPKMKVWNTIFPSVPQSWTYTASGGYVSVLGFIQVGFGGGGGVVDPVLKTDGVTRDTFENISSIADFSMGVLSYTPGKWSGDHTITVDITGSGWDAGRSAIVVIEQPYAG